MPLHPRNINVRFRGLTTNVKSLDTKQLEREASKFMLNHMISIKKELQVYPPEPGGTQQVFIRALGRYETVQDPSAYQRTYRLQKGWKILNPSKTKEGIVVRLVNNAREAGSRGRQYAAFVQGQFQTALHKATGWLTVDNARKKRLPQYRKGLQEIYDKHISAYNQAILRARRR
jgi:hypothetical protein